MIAKQLQKTICTSGWATRHEYSGKEYSWRFLCWLGLMAVSLLAISLPAGAQSFRFVIRAEPNVIPANGVSTTNIQVQVQNTGNFSVSDSTIVRFVTTSGAIESQARLVGGVARVRLRSTNKPGTALVTAIIGNAREEVEVQFIGDIGDTARYLEIAGPYVDYNSESGMVSASGLSVLDFGDLHIEGDVRMVADLFSEVVWVEGTSGNVIIRRGKGSRAATLRGDRMFYDMRRMQGVMRRVDSTFGPLRQEFEGYDLRAPADDKSQQSTTETTGDANPYGKALPGQKSSRKILPHNEAERVLSLDGVTVRLAMQQALSTHNGFNLQDNGADDSLPLLKASQEAPIAALPSADKANPQPIITRSTPGARHASIWLAGGDEAAAPTAKIFAVDTDQLLTGVDESTPEGELKAPELKSSELDVPNVEALPALPIPDPNEPEVLGAGPDSSYRPIEPVAPVELRTLRFNEPPWPELQRDRGYWITARRIRVFPHDKLQFERATIFFNGTKLFGMPLYVLALNGTINPVAGLVGFNTSGGLRLNVPFYYMASPRGTGAVYLQHAPGNGFAAEEPGFALAIEQQYFLSRNSYGKFAVDQLGRGDWNFNWEHKLQISPTTSGQVYVNMPRHRDLFTYASVVKDFSSVQLGLEGTYGRPEVGNNSAQGQIYARFRPRALGNSGWSYNVSANALARRYTQFSLDSVGGPGGGIGLPGRPRPGATELQSSATTLYGQTVNLSLQSPTYRPWRGSDINATVLASAFNYSDGRRGVSPGLLVGWRQDVGRVANLQLNYSYDKAGSGLYSVDFTHYVSAALALRLGNKISANGFVTHSLSDGSLYGTTGLDYYFRPKWRLGIFSDYTSLGDAGDANDFLNYGFTLGRIVGQREVSLNWDHDRGRFYFELGGFRL